MPGMNSGLNPADPVIVAAFRSALAHQAAIIGIIVALLLLCWGATRGWDIAGGRAQARAGLAASWREPRARRLLRLGFGLLWLFDGILQAQPKMAGGLPSQVIEPAAATSPGWVQHLVNAGGTIWNYHPIQAGAASVWIQAGIGLWLIVAVRGRVSRLAGLASVAWGLIVWAFGEAFGGIFAPGLTVLFGAPGAVLIYAVAAFTRQEGLDQVPNWLYLTGQLTRLQAVWQQYGVQVQNLPAGAMSAHNDIAYVIDAAGRLREEISDDPGPGTASSKSSWASLMAGSVRQAMGGGQ